MLAPDVGLCTGYKGFIFLCWPLNNPKQVYNSTREISNPNKKVSVRIPPRGYAKQESKFGRQFPQNTENLTKYLTIYDQKSLIIAGNKTPDAQKFFFQQYPLSNNPRRPTTASTLTLPPPVALTFSHFFLESFSLSVDKILNSPR